MHSSRNSLPACHSHSLCLLKSSLFLPPKTMFLYSCRGYLIPVVQVIVLQLLLSYTSDDPFELTQLPTCMLPRGFISSGFVRCAGSCRVCSAPVGPARLWCSLFPYASEYFATSCFTSSLSLHQGHRGILPCDPSLPPMYLSSTRALWRILTAILLSPKPKDRYSLSALPLHAVRFYLTPPTKGVPLTLYSCFRY
jgi:hypothetical protein